MDSPPDDALENLVFEQLIYLKKYSKFLEIIIPTRLIEKAIIAPNVKEEFRKDLEEESQENVKELIKGLIVD